jgi:hypothetical protein
MASQLEFVTEARGDLLIVSAATKEFHAIYVKPPDKPELFLMRRSPSADQALIAGAFQAAVEKARELGWIV